MKEKYEDFNEDDSEDGLFENCPACGRSYDHIDFDYQICSKCGWDSNKGRYRNENIRRPTEDDYMTGEADILTDTWY